MPRIWPSLKRNQDNQYDFAKLIDPVWRPPVSINSGSHSIICDIDKTYLETAFESLLNMARIAFESPQDKVTVLGAKEVLLAARWSRVKHRQERGPNQLHFVSSSPPQLRAVLEEKLLLDGLDWTSDTFKDQVYNIVRGRVDLLRQHVAYKSAAILNMLVRSDQTQTIHLIGDNAESDAFIYLGVALRLSGVLDQDTYTRYLMVAGIEEAVAASLSEKFRDLPDHRVASILIRNAPGYSLHQDDLFTSPIRTFDHYFQAALVFVNSGLIAASELPALARQFHNQYGYRRKELCSNLECFSKQANSEDMRQASQSAIEVLQSIGKVTTDEMSMDMSPADFSKFENADIETILDAASRWTARK